MMVKPKLLSLLPFLVATARASSAQGREEFASALPQEELQSLCRRHPTWNNSDGTIDYERCKDALGFELFEKDFLSNNPPEFRGGRKAPWFQNMENCMAEKSKNRPREFQSETTPAEPTVSALYPDKHSPTLAVVDFALSDEEAATFQDLRDCVKHNHPRQFVRRSFAGPGDDFEQEGGNDATFVGGFVQLFAPGVAAKLCETARVAWKKSEWFKIEDGDVPFQFDPCKMGMRTTEYLSYDPSGWSALGGHTDIGTMYTILLLLSDPSEYKGGEFFMKPWDWGGEEQHLKLVFKPKRLQALVFLSDLEYHGVQRITEGTRRALAVEIWPYANAPLGVNRPQTFEFEHYLDTGSWEGTQSYDGYFSNDPKTREIYYYEGEE